MRLLLATSILILALAGCGGSEKSPQQQPTPASAVGPGLSVSEAVASDLTGPLLVNGHVYVRGGETRLCEALAESFPPQCGVTSLLVKGLNLATVDSLKTEQGVTWSEKSVQVLGSIENGVLTVSETSL